MTTLLHPSLANLPAPQIIEEIAFEAILSAAIERYRQACLAIGVSYDVEQLQYDPAIIQLQGSGYSEASLRQRINEAIQANFLAFARGGDLDHLAAFYDVVRLYQEGDGALRERVILAIRGRSTGGTAPRYAFIARSASVRVADVAIYTIGRDPTIHAAIFSTDNGGLADASLIAQVDAALQHPDVRMVNDRIVVEAAVRTIVNVAARVWVLPTASAAVFAGLETYLRAEWAKVGKLGFDMTRSWLTAKLMRTGVQRVEFDAPLLDVLVPFNEAAALGTVTLTSMGQDY